MFALDLGGPHSASPYNLFCFVVTPVNVQEFGS